MGIRSRYCLARQITDRSRELISLYWHYKNGLLPESGGLLRQPAAYLDAMELLERIGYSERMKAKRNGGQ